MFRLGGTDEQTMARTRDYLAALCKGWRVEQVRQIVAETLHELINPYVYAEAAALIEEHQAAGRDVVLVSASGEEMVRPIGELLGVTDVIATRMACRGRPLQRRGRVLRGRAEQGRRRSASWPRSAATTWPTRTPTPTRTAIGRCWSAWGTRAWSTRTGRCAGWRRRTAWPVLEFRHPIPLGRRLRERPAVPVAAAALGRRRRRGHRHRLVRPAPPHPRQRAYRLTPARHPPDVRTPHARRRTAAAAAAPRPGRQVLRRRRGSRRRWR